MSAVDQPLAPACEKTSGESLRAAPPDGVRARPPAPPAANGGNRSLSLSASGLHWHVRPEWSAALFDRQGLDLPAWLAAWNARIVKDGPHRTVYRVDLPSTSFFVKHYRDRGPWRWLGRLWRATAARREFRRAVEVARRGVPTVRAAAVGEAPASRLTGDNYLITEAIPRSLTLQEYCQRELPRLPGPRQARMRQRIAIALAELCAASHEAGISHDDLHGGNVLLQIEPLPQNDAGEPFADAEGLPRLYLIDLPGARISRPLDWRQSRASLAMLCAGWQVGATRGDRWRFWRAYLAKRPGLQPADSRAAAGEVWTAAWTYARRLLRGRDRRSLRTNRDFVELASRDFSAHAVRDMRPETLRRLLADPAAPLRANYDRPVKLSHGSVVVEADVGIDDATIPVAYKRARVKRWWKSLFALARPSRALGAWKLGQALLQRGIATARPLAVCEPRRFSFRSTSYLVTEWIAGAENMHLYLWRIAERDPRERSRRARQCAASLGRLVGRMHAWHVAHRDLKGCNLVAVERAATVDTYLIDLDGMRIARRLRQGKKIRNLARIAVSAAAHPWLSRTDRLRFLRAYLGEQPATAPRWKQLWREIEYRALRMQASQARKGGPLA